MLKKQKQKNTTNTKNAKTKALYIKRKERERLRKQSLLFKKAFLTFRSEISKEVAASKKYYMPLTAITFTDVQYLNDDYSTYYSYGPNSIVIFHIKEIPGWLFGIWWEPFPDCDIKKSLIPYDVHGKFFTQYEEEIDKFKPSTSNIAIEFDLGMNKMFYNPKKHTENTLDDKILIVRQIKFIHDEPELAFCRSYYGWDYNYEHHTRHEAIAAYKDYKRNKARSAAENQRITDKIFAFTAAEILPNLKKSFIYDHGEGYYPRYEIMAPYEDQSDAIRESCSEGPGVYDLNGMFIPNLSDKIDALMQSDLGKYDDIKYLFHAVCGLDFFKKDARAFFYCKDQFKKDIRPHGPYKIVKGGFHYETLLKRKRVCKGKRSKRSSTSSRNKNRSAKHK